MLSSADPDEISGGLFKAAKTKDDADIYVAGGFVATEGSSPIVMMDGKFQYGFPSGRAYHWAGVAATYASNTDSQAPVKRTDIDPDSITLHFQADRGWQIDKWGLYGLQLVVEPFGGEFSRDPRSGNVSTAGRLSMFSKPFLNQSMVFDPFIGYELGKNIQHPTTLFERPVDLSSYDKIARFRFGATVHYYLFSGKITNDAPYRLVLSASWQRRVLGTNEPFVESGDAVNEKGEVTRQQILTLTSDPRDYVEGGVTWNATKLFGVEIKVKRGAQPPLFKFVAPQIAIGLTFKTKISATDFKPL
jgi:hypothetical protein